MVITDQEYTHERICPKFGYRCSSMACIASCLYIAIEGDKIVGVPADRDATKRTLVDPKKGRRVKTTRINQ